MFSKIMKKVTVCVMAVIMAVLLTGCGNGQVAALSTVSEMIGKLMGSGKSEQHTNYVFVLSPRANSADPNETFLEEYAEEAARYGVNVSVISVCGTPRVVSSMEIDERRSGLSEMAENKIVKRKAEEILSLIRESKADTAESDLFKAFTLAGREAKKSGAKYGKIVVSDNGISTAGLMSFNTAALDGRITGDEISRNLKEMEVLPDLSDLEIVWQGVGDCKAPQMDLYENNRENVEEIWKKVLSDCGADVSFDGAVTSSSDITDSSLYPEVTTVVATSPGDAMDIEGVTDFSELCRFKPGSPELLTDEGEVLKQLGKYIDYMNSHPNYRLLIVGTTASADTAEVLASLSKARCETIRTLLVKAGADSARIEAVGLGYEPSRFCIKDTDESGKFVEELGQKNRRVLLMSADHEEAANVRSLAVS